MFQSQNSPQERTPEPHPAVQAVVKLFDWDTLHGGQSPLEPEKLERLLSKRLNHALPLYAEIPAEQRDTVFGSVLRAFCPRWPLCTSQLYGLNVIFGEGARLPPAAIADAISHCGALIAAGIRDGAVEYAERFVSLLGAECLQEEEIVKAIKDRLLFELSDRIQDEDRSERILDHALNFYETSPFVQSIRHVSDDPEIQAAVKTYLHDLLNHAGEVLELYGIADLFGAEQCLRSPEFRREAAAYILRTLSIAADADVPLGDTLNVLYYAIERAAFLDWTPNADNTLPQETSGILPTIRAVAETIVLRILRVEQGDDLADPILWGGLPYFIGLFCSDEFRCSEPVLRACAERIKGGADATDMLQERLQSIRIILGDSAYHSLIRDPSISFRLMNIACDEIEACRYGGTNEWNDSAEYPKAGNIDLVLSIASSFGVESDEVERLRDLGGRGLADVIDDYLDQQEMFDRFRASLRETLLFKDPLGEEAMHLLGRFSAWFGERGESAFKSIDVLHDLFQTHYGKSEQAPLNTLDGIIGFYRFMKDPWVLGLTPKEALMIAARSHARHGSESPSFISSAPEEEQKIDSLESQRVLFVYWDDSERVDRLSSQIELLARSYKGGRNQFYLAFLQQTRDTLQLEPDTLRRALDLLDVRDKLNACSDNGVIEEGADRDPALLEIQMKELCQEAQEALNAARLARAASLDKDAHEKLSLDLYKRARQALGEALDIEAVYTAAKIELFLRGELGSFERAVSHEVSTKWEMQSNLALAFLGARQPNRAAKQMQDTLRKLSKVLNGRSLNADERHAAVVYPFKAMLDTACRMALHGHRFNASSFAKSALKLHKRAVSELPSSLVNRMDREVVEVRFLLHTTISQTHLGLGSSKVAHTHAKAALRLTRIPGFDKKCHRQLILRMREVFECTRSEED